MPSLLNRLASVHGAAIDGRTTSVRFQQSQLTSLHKRLQEMRDEMCKAIISDRGLTIAEAELEYTATVHAIKQYYEAIDFDESVKDEYRLAKGQDNADRRVGAGVVLIRPIEHTRLYSIVATVAAAIAAGNTFAIEVRSEKILTKYGSIIDLESL